MTRPTLTAAMVRAALKAAGQVEASEFLGSGIDVATTGFHVFDTGRRISVAALLGEDLGDPEMPEAFTIGRRLLASYREALESAGYGVAFRGYRVDVTSAPREG